MEVIALITQSGKTAFELAFFILLPLITVMTTLLAISSKLGILGLLEKAANRIISTTGLSGLSLVAFIQMNFVSFAAPIGTLKVMDQSHQADRVFAATLVLILSSSQANLLFPLGGYGLDLLTTSLISTGCSVTAAIATYHLTGYTKLAKTGPATPALTPKETRDLLQIIVESGHEAFKTVLNTLPLLTLSMLLVSLLGYWGILALTIDALRPLLLGLGIDPAISLTLLTKYTAGGSASLIPISQLQAQGLLSEELLNRHVGLFINSFDLPGIAIMLAATPRVGKVLMYALPGILIALMARAVLHLVWF